VEAPCPRGRDDALDVGPRQAEHAARRGAHAIGHRSRWPDLVMSTVDANAWNLCLDCESPLIPCDCREGCTGGMCSNPTCNETLDMTTAQRDARRALISKHNFLGLGNQIGATR